jgi:hypothetical protein
VEMDDPQGAGQATPIVSISEAPLSIVECSPGIYRVITCENQKDNFDSVKYN